MVTRQLGVDQEETRRHEWFVPNFGGTRFRLFLGLSFYPYTLMNASYVLIGSLIAPVVHFDRMWTMAAVYLLAVGISAHALDATGPNKPWGAVLTRRQLQLLALGALVPSLGLGLYLAVTYALILLPLGALELFLLLAYNLELFGRRFHTDGWFALSWGFLPVVVGYAVQTNTISPVSLAGGLFGFFTAFVEINASRPYKALKKQAEGRSSPLAAKFEWILKSVVASVLSAALFLLFLNIFG